MTTSHTPGKLVVTEYDADYYEIDNSHGYQVIEAYSKEDARRLVACWNACDGLPTADLENSALPEIMANLMEAKVQRDELLAALKSVLAGIDEVGKRDGTVFAGWGIEAARAAIAKATGEQK